MINTLTSVLFVGTTTSNKALFVTALRSSISFSAPFSTPKPTIFHQNNQNSGLSIFVRNPSQRSGSQLFMAADKSSDENNKQDKNKKNKKNKKKPKNDFETYDGSKGNQHNATLSIQKKDKQKQKKKQPQESQYRSEKMEVDVEALKKRLKQLECLVSNQSVEILKLRQECVDLKEAAAAFAQVVELLRQAGLTTPALDGNEIKGNNEDDSNQQNVEENTKISKNESSDSKRSYEYFDDTEIFGLAPSSVIDAADTAGAAILAAMLGGKLRMLVDVRDAELSRDSDILVQFIELAILPVAAGLEGLTRDGKHRVKIVFPTVKQLLQYRKTMALAAPEVVALSTLGFDSVEESDSLVVVVAPRPDDEEGMAHLQRLLNPSNIDEQLRQPVVILNYHMLPIAEFNVTFTKVYHLRLLSVQYMTGDMNPEYIDNLSSAEASEEPDKMDLLLEGGEDIEDVNKMDADKNSTFNSDEDAALEAAMEHAHQIGVAQGITRAMVIRAYPRPWHVFVDTSPDADADFEVAATFDEEPTQEEVNYAIIECLEGSEREDELVAQQMQEALESGQLTQISEMLGALEQKDKVDDGEEDDDEDDFYFDLFNEDSV